MRYREISLTGEEAVAMLNTLTDMLADVVDYANKIIEDVDGRDTTKVEDEILQVAYDVHANARALKGMVASGYGDIRRAVEQQ